MLSVIVSTSVGACGDPTCEFDNPCPERFDLTAWCFESGKCTVDGAPYKSGGLKRGAVLEIPIGEVVDALPGLDILVSLAGAGCAQGDFPKPTDMSLALDGQPGAPWTYQYSEKTYAFRWDPPPSNPKLMAVRYDNPSLMECIYPSLSATDATCEAAHPQPVCGL